MPLRDLLRTVSASDPLGHPGLGWCEPEIASSSVKLRLPSPDLALTSTVIRSAGSEGKIRLCTAQPGSDRGRLASRRGSGPGARPDPASGIGAVPRRTALRRGRRFRRAIRSSRDFGAHDRESRRLRCPHADRGRMNSAVAVGPGRRDRIARVVQPGDPGHTARAHWAEHVGKPRRLPAGARQHGPVPHGNPVSDLRRTGRCASAGDCGRDSARRRLRPWRERGPVSARSG